MLSDYLRALGADRHEAPEPLPGFVLIHRGNEIGIVERVDIDGGVSSRVVQARGGLSGSLEYILPVSALCSVRLDDRRAVVADEVTFEPVTVEGAGHVQLAARGLAALGGELSPRMPESHCEGFRVFADDGYLGEVESALFLTRPDRPAYFVVRVRRRLRSRYPVISVSRVVTVYPPDRVLFVAGSRSEFAGLSEQLPISG